MELAGTLEVYVLNEIVRLYVEHPSITKTSRNVPSIVIPPVARENAGNLVCT